MDTVEHLSMLTALIYKPFGIAFDLAPLLQKETNIKTW